MPSLDAAFTAVLAHEHFGRYGREALLTIDGFSEAIRTAPHSALTQLGSELEAIAYENEDHSEASGLLMVTTMLGGGVDLAVTHRDDLPVDDASAFADLVIATPAPERSTLLDEVMDALLRRVVTLAPGDHDAWRTHHHVGVLTEYALRPASDLRHPDATASFNRNLTWEEQPPPRLWEALTSRPPKDVERITTAWWGATAKQPHDLTLALGFQAAGHITLERTPGYLEAVAAHVLHHWAPGHDGEATDAWAAHALTAYPLLAADFYEALATPKGFAWLTAVGSDAQRASVVALANAGHLDGPTLARLIDEGLARGWGGPREGRALVLALREALG